MSTQIIEELVMEKRAAQAEVYGLHALIGTLALQHGTEKSSEVIEYRVSKAARNKVNGRGIQIRELKSGGLVITLRKQDSE